MRVTRQCEDSNDYFVMVLLSKIIMVLATVVSLSQSSPRRISSKRKHLRHGTSITNSISNNNIGSSSSKHYSLNTDNTDQPTNSKSTANGNNNWGGYEHLCETVTKTVHLNTDSEEYNPPFYIAVRCRNPHDSGSFSNVQKCAFNLLHCVQTYTTMYFSKRISGEDCWQPYALEIPSGCECMWPVEEFGPLNRRDDL